MRRKTALPAQHCISLGKIDGRAMRHAMAIGSARPRDAPRRARVRSGAGAPRDGLFIDPLLIESALPGESVELEAFRGHARSNASQSEHALFSGCTATAGAR